MAIRVVKKGQFRELISVLKKGSLDVLNWVVKKRQFRSGYQRG